ncbi:hypothetical protein ES703_18929 [subsurface metagenome]
MEPNKSYRTSDIYITAWLLSKGLKLAGIDRHNNQRCQFIFIDRPDRPELVTQFLCGSATGNVVDFVFYMRRAKRLLYSREA